jgi:uncharacterized protein YcsI (UPF0317 family)
MSKVYAPQVPSKYDPATKLWVPTLNLDHAKSFGEVVVMLPPNANRLHINPLVTALRDQMKDFTEEDYIIAVGDPSLIGIANLAVPDYGDAVELLPDEIPVFWACGVTPQSAILNAQPAFCITHAPGCMLITDLFNHQLASF